MAEQYKLTYFNGRGAGEIIRLVFAVAGQQYEDERVPRDQWPQRKPDMPMQQMPVLTITKGGKSTVFCQSGAISKHLARKFGLFGSNETEAFLIDEMLESLGDTMRDLQKAMFGTDENQKKESMKNFKETSVPRFCRFFNLRQKEFGSKYAIGEKLSLADLSVFNFVDQITRRGFGDVWDNKPVVKELYELFELVQSDSRVKTWLDKRPDSEF
uniref:Glutathione S-transferase n=1 Tax=Sinonovacula constricta TaxID=98310 RepID=A0A513U7U3_SINCO|nr:glutathione S-transferase [Sinonovacula constricta]